jgi:hypothetical protein
MAYKYSGRIIRAGKAWTDNDGIQHPANWMLWDAATKAAKGLVWEDDPDNSFDGRFYWSAGVAKALDDVTEEDGTITKGLKSNAIATVKAQAAGLLAPTDWYVVRKSETDVAIPATIATFRAAVRTASGTIEAAITAAADLDAFMALYDTPEDGNAPINDWPEEV